MKRQLLLHLTLKLMSPPVRGAWIETFGKSLIPRSTACRPPCGGRGLKPLRIRRQRQIDGRPPCGGRGLKPDLSAILS